jgi:hypothetical protein
VNFGWVAKAKAPECHLPGPETQTKLKSKAAHGSLQCSTPRVLETEW